VQKLHRVERKVCTDYPQACRSDFGIHAICPANCPLMVRARRFVEVAQPVLLDIARGIIGWV
jgi:hypothetical protein